MPKDAQHLEEFTRLLGLAWYGEGLPSLTLKTLIHLLRPKRKNISPEVRKELSTKQGGQCAKCGREDTLEADHVHPISVDPFNRNDEDNLELLCAECHLAKTTSQQFQTDFNPIRSYFNEHTWANFVLSARPQQQVYRSSTLDKRLKCQLVDVKRCRRNRMAHGAYPWYVFSIWDEIVPIDTELMDFNFVAKPAPANATEMVRQAPHVGPAWRTREACAYMLNAGILTWDDITHGINASCSLPASYFTEALDKIDELWDQTGKPELKKLAVNSMLGLMANAKEYTFLVKTHDKHMDDTVFEGIKVKRELKEFALEEVVLRFKQVKNHTMSTLHRHIPRQT